MEEIKKNTYRDSVFEAAASYVEAADAHREYEVELKDIMRDADREARLIAEAKYYHAAAQMLDRDLELLHAVERWREESGE